MLVWVPPEPQGAGRNRDTDHFASESINYRWAFETDIKACFDEIGHSALMGRLRVRIKDKRICALVKVFLKSGPSPTSETGKRLRPELPKAEFFRRRSLTLPCRRWTTISTGNGSRRWDPSKSGPTAEERQGKLETLPLCGRPGSDGVGQPAPRRGSARGGCSRACLPGLRLPPSRPGWSISMRASRSSALTSAASEAGNLEDYVYTKPSRKAIASIKDKAKAKTYRSTLHIDLD